jgi:hypothetical protein
MRNFKFEWGVRGNRTALMGACVFATMLLATGCGRVGTFSGGGKLNLNGGLAPLTDPGGKNKGAAEMPSFNFHVTIVDKNKDGWIDEGDRFEGMFGLTVPGGQGIEKRLNAAVVFGGICNLNGQDWELEECFVPGDGANDSLAPGTRASIRSLVRSNSAAANLRRTHPEAGIAWMLGVYNAANGNPGRCVTEFINGGGTLTGADCRAVLAIAVDVPKSAPGPSNEDLLIVYTELSENSVLAGTVEKGNLQIANTSTTPR